MEGHFTAGFGQGEDAPDKQIEIVGDAVRQGEKFLVHHPKTRERFDRVSELISGFETPFGMELLSTVHWVARQEEAQNIERTIEKTHSWNDRKQMFSPEQIRIAWQTLEKTGWLEKPRNHKVAPQ